jgi:hypothetical protein
MIVGTSLSIQLAAAIAHDLFDRLVKRLIVAG